MVRWCSGYHSCLTAVSTSDRRFDPGSDHFALFCSPVNPTQRSVRRHSVFGRGAIAVGVVPVSAIIILVDVNNLNPYAHLRFRLSPFVRRHTYCTREPTGIDEREMEERHYWASDGPAGWVLGTRTGEGWREPLDEWVRCSISHLFRFILAIHLP